MNEREISLVDLLAEILLHWRGIIIAMIVGGALLGAFSYARSARSAQEEAARLDEMQNKEINVEEELAKAEKELTEIQRNNIEYALYYEDLYRKKQEYAKKSILMQMDPDKVYRMDMTFLVTSEDLEKSYNMEKVYEDLINSPELQEKLAEKCDVTASLAAEIYSFGRNSSGTMKGSDTFRVTVMHYDEETCKELAEMIIDFVEQGHGAVSRKMGAHEITVLNQTEGTMGSGSVLSTQNSVRSELLNLQASAEKTKDAFSEEEKHYYDLLTLEDKADEEPEAEEDAEGTSAPGVSLKYVFLGIVMAAFVYAFVIFMLYVMNNKLRGTDHFQALYDIPQLGQIPAAEKKKKLFGFVDKWILALRYWNQRKFTEEEALNLATVAVKMAVGKEELDTVCLIGCDLKGQTMGNCEKMKELLAREKVETKILDNVLYNAEAMEKLEEVKAVVLVEKAGSTLYTEIVQELELLKRQEIKVLGGIVVE